MPTTHSGKISPPADVPFWRRISTPSADDKFRHTSMYNMDHRTTDGKTHPPSTTQARAMSATPPPQSNTSRPASDMQDASPMVTAPMTIPTVPNTRGNRSIAEELSTLGSGPPLPVPVPSGRSTEALMPRKIRERLEGSLRVPGHQGTRPRGFTQDTLPGDKSGVPRPRQGLLLSTSGKPSQMPLLPPQVLRSG